MSEAHHGITQMNPDHLNYTHLCGLGYSCIQKKHKIEVSDTLSRQHISIYKQYVDQSQTNK